MKNATDGSAGGGLTPEALEAAIAEAVGSGKTVIRSSPTTILLDLDNVHAIEQYARVLPILQRQMECVETSRWRSKNGNLHVVLTLGEPMQIRERLLLQAVLGSDPIRELLSLIRVHNDVVEPSLLFQPKK